MTPKMQPFQVTVTVTPVTTEHGYEPTVHITTGEQWVSPVDQMIALSTALVHLINGIEGVTEQQRHDATIAMLKDHGMLKRDA